MTDSTDSERAVLAELAELADSVVREMHSVLTSKWDRDCLRAKALNALYRAAALRASHGNAIPAKRMEKIKTLAANWKDIASDEEAAPTGSMLTVINELISALSRPLPKGGAETDDKIIDAAYRNWAWKKEGTPIGLMIPSDACWVGFNAGAKWALSLSSPVPSSGEVAYKCVAPSKAACAWPDCGCDPYANNVIQELVDKGWTAPSASPAETAGESGDAQGSPGQQCLSDMTLANNVRMATIEECARVAEAQRDEFLSPQYAANQPHGSFCERFACDVVAKAIRDLAISSAERGTEA